MMKQLFNKMFQLWNFNNSLLIVWDFRVQINFRISYPNCVVTIVKCRDYEGCLGISWNLVIKCSNTDILYSYFEISQVDIIQLASHS